jgi:hypothetical protein
MVMVHGAMEDEVALALAAGVEEALDVMMDDGSDDVLDI